MNTRLVNSAAGVINAALTQNRTAAGIALALDSAQLLMSPEKAAELEALELGAVDGRVSATCEDPTHPTWLRAEDDQRGCPWCRVAELEAALGTMYRAEYESIVMGYYRTREAARDHCVTVARRETPNATLEWRTDEPTEDDSPEELFDLGDEPGDKAFGIGYVVTPLEVPAEYDPDADE
ncbi:MAG: hypothetical protein HOZ81_10875 [Streptomyces sp.]|nr:hypothetical protein [Streptomyces sp.]NUS24246.1 hypothetical protein [Streptomyces sp.]